MTETKVKKWVLWLSKIAIMIISAPATVGVVAKAYENIEAAPWVVFMVQAAALVVVEGAFLYFWQLVEDNKSLQTKEESEQLNYVVSAWAMYLLLLFVGIIHKEGAVALILRFAMGLLMYSATNDKMQAMYRKYETERASGKRKSRKVRKAEAQAEETLALYIIEKNILEQKKAVDNQTLLLTRVGEASAQSRILSLNKMEIVDGDVVEITKALPANTATNPVPAPPAQPDEPSTSGVGKNAGVEEIGCCVLEQHGEDFVVTCKVCGWTSTKLAKDTKNARTSAIRAGSRHCGQHTKEEKDSSSVEIVEENLETYALDEKYVLYHEEGGMWVWECGLCKVSCEALWDTKEDAQEDYHIHAAEHKHTGNDVVVKSFSSADDEVTFSK